MEWVETEDQKALELADFTFIPLERTRDVNRGKFDNYLKWRSWGTTTLISTSPRRPWSFTGHVSLVSSPSLWLYISMGFLCSFVFFFYPYCKHHRIWLHIGAIHLTILWDFMGDVLYPQHLPKDSNQCVVFWLISARQTSVHSALLAFLHSKLWESQNCMQTDVKIHVTLLQIM